MSLSLDNRGGQGKNTRRSKQESSFFEKKEAKKLFLLFITTGYNRVLPPFGRLRGSLRPGRGTRNKVFLLLFFQKKKTLASLTFERRPSRAVTSNFGSTP